jgi:hypothetical protein
MKSLRRLQLNEIPFMVNEIIASNQETELLKLSNLF